MTQVLHQPSQAPGLPAPVAPAAGQEAVGPDDVEQLHGDDWKAAAMVAGLMVGIFTAGLIMYIIIALSALAGSS